MSIFNSVVSSLTRKRFNSESNPTQERNLKKHRVHNEAIRHDPPATTSNEGRISGDNLATTKNQANKLIMAFIQTHSKVETTNHTPHAYLTENVYSTALTNKIMESSAFSYEERQLWSLAALLFEQEKFSPSSNDVPIPTPTTPAAMTKNQRRRLRKWMCSTVFEELQRTSLHNVDTDKIDDDWKRAFYYLSSGKVIQACELVQQLGDDALATMMVVHFQLEDDVCNPSQKQVSYWQAHGLFDSMPLYRKKMWYVLQGQLGYVDHIKSVVTQDLLWPQVLLLYTLYGGRRGDPSSGLSDYHYRTSSDGSGIIGIHQLRARKHTAQVPSDCLWYILLQWWSSSTSTSDDKATYRKELEMSLPLQCRWVLLLHMSPYFEHGNDDLELWKQQWCDELDNTKLEYMAIHAGLFLARPETKIKELLSKHQLSQEHYLCRQLQIPIEWITHTKALHALKHQLYDKEADYYLEAKENEKARDAILNHMIPALFFDGKRIDTINTYLGKLTTLFPNDMDLQHAISTLHTIHIILNDYPRIITRLSSTPEQLTTMVNEVICAIQNLTFLDELENLRDPFFCSKVAGQMISTAALFMDDKQLNTLIESCPVKVYSGENILELVSRKLSRSIAKKTLF